MSNPISFTSVTPRLGLPQLFAAQAQKEFIVNETLARVDMLLHCAVEGVANDAPAAPADGEVWIVGEAPAGEWLGHPGELAGRQAGTWIFAAPREGMRVFARDTQQVAFWQNGWQRAQPPAGPQGGGTIDTEARTAIANLIESLRDAGIFGTP
jgi:hypothetical protein